jgi:hypothetical protein
MGKERKGAKSGRLRAGVSQVRKEKVAIVK